MAGKGRLVLKVSKVKQTQHAQKLYGMVRDSELNVFMGLSHDHVVR